MSHRSHFRGRAGFAAVAVFATCTVLLGLAPAALTAASGQPLGRDHSPFVADGSHDRGSWTVAPAKSGDASTLVWRSPVRLTVGDARPEFRDGTQVLGYPRLSADRRSLVLRLDAAPAAIDDPMVWSGGVRLDAQFPVEAAAPTYQAPTRGRPVSPDPGVKGDHPIASTEYKLRGIDFGEYAHKIEMLGHVVGATDVAAAPLVVFLHGRHSVCYNPDQPERWAEWPCTRKGFQPIPSYLGYDYIQRLLASQGYVTLSISANGVNGQDFLDRDGGAKARSKLIRTHLQRWANDKIPGDWEDAVDLRQVVLVGHSRGGEGVDQAATDIGSGAPYQIAGDVLIAPTDFRFQVARGVPSVTLLPYCDGDVYDLQGQVYLERGLDTLKVSRAFHSSVMVMGANHNFFNTEWTPSTAEAPATDDWWDRKNAFCGQGAKARLTALEQRQVGKAYVAGAVDRLLHPSSGTAAMFDGSRVFAPSAGDADVRSHAVGVERRFVFPSAMTLSGSRGTTVHKCLGSLRAKQHCGDANFGQGPHWLIPKRVRPPRHAVDFSWSARDSRAAIDLARPLDLSRAASLDARVAVKAGNGAARLGVRLVDGAGATVEVTPVGRGILRAYPGGRALGRLWAQTLRVRLAGVSGVDLSDVHRVVLVAKSAGGRVFVLDLAAVR